MPDPTKKTVAPVAGQELATSPDSPAAMIQAALASGTSPADLTALYELYERDQANKARQAFNRAVTEFKKAPPAILKTKQVAYKEVRYRHAELDKIMDAVTPALCQVGLSVRWENGQTDSLVTVRCILSHVDGHSEHVELSGPRDNSGSKNPVQAVGSTVTYLQRYTLLSILGLAAKGTDNDGAGAGMGGADSNTISEEQVLKIQAFVDENEIDAGPFKDYLAAQGYDSYADIPVRKFDGIMGMLRKKAASKARE